VKRFYKDVSVEQTDAGHYVVLDGRPIKTQGGQPQVVAGKALAEALAAEWDAQGEKIDPALFVFRDMTDYALDIVPGTLDELIAKLLRYAETDTLCYRADADEPLWHRQRDVWDPLVEALEAREGITLERVSGIVAKPHPEESMARLEARLETLDAFALAALEQLTSLAASLCVGLAALEPDADGEALWAAANLEEDWQVEQWGADEEAAERRSKRLTGFLKAMEFVALARR
jgi:chaperone required for assembly of F1-ATPase